MRALSCVLLGDAACRNLTGKSLPVAQGQAGAAQSSKAWSPRLSKQAWCSQAWHTKYQEDSKSQGLGCCLQVPRHPCLFPAKSALSGQPQGPSCRWLTNNCFPWLLQCWFRHATLARFYLAASGSYRAGPVRVGSLSASQHPPHTLHKSGFRDFSRRLDQSYPNPPEAGSGRKESFPLPWEPEIAKPTFPLWTPQGWYGLDLCCLWPGGPG